MNKRLLHTGSIAFLTTIILVLLLIGVAHARSLPPRPVSNTGVWMIEPIDEVPPNLGSFALAIDSDNDIHMLFGEAKHLHQDLYYLYQDAGIWYTEPVTTPFSSSRLPLVLDENDRPHSVFGTSAAGVTYAYRDGDGWHFEPIEHGFAKWLALDEQGFPHISYVRTTINDNELRYAYRDEDGWHLSTLPPVQNISSYYTQIALDTSGYPHIIFNTTGSTGGGRHFYQDNSGWHVENVADSLGYRSLVLDQNNYLHLSYADSISINESEVHYIYRDELAWHDEVVDNTLGTEDVWLALRRQDSVPLIAYVDEAYSRADLFYAEKSPSGWQIEIVDGSEKWGYITAVTIVLDNDDRPHIFYVMSFENQFPELRHAYLVDTAALQETTYLPNVTWDLPE